MQVYLRSLYFFGLTPLAVVCVQVSEVFPFSMAGPYDGLKIDNLSQSFMSKDRPVIEIHEQGRERLRNHDLRHDLP